MRTYKVKVEPEDIPLMQMATLSFSDMDTNPTERIIVDILLQIEAQEEERNRERTYD